MIITKRLYGATVIIFLTLLLLFMGFQVGKEVVSAPEINKHITTGYAARRSTSSTIGFVPLNKQGQPETLSQQEAWVLYCGEENGEYAATVKEWSYYTGMPVAVSKTLPAGNASALPDLLMIEPGMVSGQTRNIASLLEKGVNVVFLALPSYGDIQFDGNLQKLLGIHRMVQEEVRLQGVHLFKGFLLGGERIFEEETLEEGQESRQDLELTVPWYSVRTETKTYLRGRLSEEDMKAAEEKKYKNEDMPAIVWRHHYGKGEAYAVNGSYMKNRLIGMGMLQAMVYEQEDFQIYPVVNAQVLSVDCIPLLTDENQTESEKIYGRSLTKTQSDIIMPMFITLSAKYDKKPSCFLSVKYDRSDRAQPQQDILKKFLPMLDEMNGELALSVNYRDLSLADETVKADCAYLADEAPAYRFTAAMSRGGSLSGLADTLTAAGAKNVRTVSDAAYDGSFPVVGYLSDSITCQQTTSDLNKHTFTNELELLGVQTLLAYSNSYYSMADAFYPETKKDEWQNSSRDVFSNLTTYSHPFQAVDNLTVTESDDRIRTYFGLKYDAVRRGDTVTVNLDCGLEKVGGYFILRTHNEEITSLSGGTYKEMEEGAYLISAEQDKLAIKLTSSLSTLVDMEGSNR